MNMMARPALDYEPIIINIKLSLHPEHDVGLLAWFDSLPRRGRATAVITRLRLGKGVVAEVETVQDKAVTDALSGLLL